MSDSNIPSDIILRAPPTDIALDLRHFLLEIPWDEKYLRNVPEEFREFFLFVLPHLHVRTTDVHVATCLGMLEEFCQKGGFLDVNKRVVGLSLILHDCGWSLLSQEEIAQSLGVTGLQLTDTAMGPKEKHAVIGANLAKKLLSQFEFTPPLSDDERDLIVRAVLYHDKPWEVAGSKMPAEVQILVDLDHIWSFTHENFWQDTQRKGIDAQQYANNLSQDIDGYFVTSYGKQKARELLEKREREIYDLENPTTH